MTNVKRSWEILDENEKSAAINEIISFFRNERGEEIGVIAAGNILDLFLQKVGLTLYNKGVDDAKDFLKKRFEESEIDLEASVKKTVE
jgi:uncharacterized protein (DUF2164 family)